MAKGTINRSPRDQVAEEDLGWALGALIRSYRESIAPALGDFPHGARGYETVRQLLKGGERNQLSLSNHLGIDRTVMTYLLDDLVDSGFVERRPNPEDRRQRLVVATPEGQRAVEHLCQQVVAAEQAMLAGLTDDEQALFRRLLTSAAYATNISEQSACTELSVS